MKISKERLKEIIKEEIYELGLSENEEGEQDAQLVKTKNDMRKKFYELYQKWMQVKGISLTELKAFDALMTASIKLMQQGEAAPKLKMALQRLGVDPSEPTDSAESAE